PQALSSSGSPFQSAPHSLPKRPDLMGEFLGRHRLYHRSCHGRERCKTLRHPPSPPRRFLLPAASGPRFACARPAVSRARSPAGGPAATTPPLPVTAGYTL